MAYPKITVNTGLVLNPIASDTLPIPSPDLPQLSGTTTAATSSKLVDVGADFSNVELFPVRGRISTPINILFAGRWKKYAEKTNINIFLDKFFSNETNAKQCSGFNFIVKK